MVARNATAAIEFEDERQASLLLDALRAEVSVRQALILRPDGTGFVSLGGRAPMPAGSARWPCAADASRGIVRITDIQVMVPVQLHGEILGNVYVRTDLAAMYRNLAITFVLLLAAASWLAGSRYGFPTACSEAS